MSNYDWRHEALCRDAVDNGIDFFSDKKRQISKAKKICAECPVRRECLESALENETAWGVWGGRDQDELRIALAIDEDGETFDWNAAAVCPFCFSTDLDVTRKRRVRVHVTCESCGLEWDRRRIIRPRTKRDAGLPTQKVDL